MKTNKQPNKQIKTSTKQKQQLKHQHQTIDQVQKPTQFDQPSIMFGEKKKKKSLLPWPEVGGEAENKFMA